MQIYPPPEINIQIFIQKNKKFNIFFFKLFEQNLEFSMRMFNVWKAWADGTRGRK